MHVAYFDLETTGISTRSEIVQIAVETENGDKFNQYVFPLSHYIPLDAQTIHGMSIVDNELCKDGEKLPNVVIPSKAFEQFKHFLENLRQSDQEKIVLCAHNGLCFDSKVLIYNLVKRNELTMPANVEFRDSLDILKKYREQIGSV